MMLDALSTALPLATLAALVLVPALTLALHAVAALASLAAPVAAELCDVAAALVAYVTRPADAFIAPTVYVPLCGVACVDRITLAAFADTSFA